jgi:hypothetical protein
LLPSDFAAQRMPRPRFRDKRREEFASRDLSLDLIDSKSTFATETMPLTCYQTFDGHYAGMRMSRGRQSAYYAGLQNSLLINTAVSMSPCVLGNTEKIFSILIQQAFAFPAQCAKSP